MQGVQHSNKVLRFCIFFCFLIRTATVHKKGEERVVIFRLFMAYVRKIAARIFVGWWHWQRVGSIEIGFA